MMEMSCLCGDHPEQSRGRRLWPEEGADPGNEGINMQSTEFKTAASV